MAVWQDPEVWERIVHWIEKRHFDKVCLLKFPLAQAPFLPGNSDTWAFGQRRASFTQDFHLRLFRSGLPYLLWFKCLNLSPYSREDHGGETCYQLLKGRQEDVLLESHWRTTRSPKIKWVFWAVAVQLCFTLATPGDVWAQKASAAHFPGPHVLV